MKKKSAIATAFVKPKLLTKVPKKSLNRSQSVCPDCTIYCTLGNILKLVATIILAKSPTFSGNFWIGIKIFQFSSEIIFGQLLLTFGVLLLVTLIVSLVQYWVGGKYCRAFLHSFWLKLWIKRLVSWDVFTTNSTMFFV